MTSASNVSSPPNYILATKRLNNSLADLLPEIHIPEQLKVPRHHLL
jgi:hypothetical protein